MGFFVECLSQTKHQTVKDIFKFGGESLMTELQEFFAAMLYPRDIDRVAEPSFPD